MRRLLESLAENPEAKDSVLFINIDGPRAVIDRELIEECREIAESAKGYKQVVPIFHEKNLGLADSIISGVSKVLRNYESVIVLEDDLVVGREFLKYMNWGIAQYASQTKVASIHGYQYPIRGLGGKFHFLRGADCWGWATWRDRWRATNFDSGSLYQQIVDQSLKHEFNLFGALQNLDMLKKQASGEIDSWAIRWHASMFLQNRLTLYPPRSLVLNLGLDGSGTHEGESKVFNTTLSEHDLSLIPVDMVESALLRRKLFLYFIKLRVASIFRKFVSELFIHLKLSHIFKFLK